MTWTNTRRVVVSLHRGNLTVAKSNIACQCAADQLQPNVPTSPYGHGSGGVFAPAATHSGLSSSQFQTERLGRDVLGCERCPRERVLSESGTRRRGPKLR